MRTSVPPTQRSARAFTLKDLLATTAIVVFFLILLLPAGAASRTRSQGFRCLENLRQIMNAVMIYTKDNHDFLPPNPDDGNSVQGHNWCAGQAGRGGSAEFNPDILADPRRCLITGYLNTNIDLFLCPADLRTGKYQGTNPVLFGKPVPAARSIAMSGAVGTICPGFDIGAGHSGIPTLSVNGPWLDGIHGHRRNSPWRTYGKLSEMLVPAPSALWVVIEEDAMSINDAGFQHGMNTAEWIDWPATRHDMAGVVAFADGRAELHKWTDPRTRVTDSVARRPVPGSADWRWLSDRTSTKAR